MDASSREQLVRTAKTECFSRLLLLSGLNPMRSFRYSNWAGVDFSERENTVVDLTGANIREATFDYEFLSTNLVRWTQVTDEQHRARAIARIGFDHDYRLLPLALLLNSRPPSDREEDQSFEFLGLRIRRPKTRVVGETRHFTVIVTEEDGRQMIVEAAQKEDRKLLKLTPTLYVSEHAVNLARRILDFVPGFANRERYPFHLRPNETFCDGDRGPLMQCTSLAGAPSGNSAEQLLHSVHPLNKYDFSAVVRSRAPLQYNADDSRFVVVASREALHYGKRLSTFARSTYRLPTVREMTTLLERFKPVKRRSTNDVFWAMAGGRPEDYDGIRWPKYDQLVRIQSVKSELLRGWRTDLATETFRIEEHERGNSRDRELGALFFVVQDTG